MQREFIYSDKWLDLLFEKRNRLYGAYMLRKRLPYNVLIGYMSAVLFMGALLFTLYKFSAVSFDEMLKTLNDPVRDVKTYEVKIEPAKANPAKEKIERKNFDKPSSQNSIPIIVDSSNAIDDNTKNKESETKNGGSPQIGKDSSEGPGDEPKSSDFISREPKTIVENMPQFPGGESSMYKYMRNNTPYPGRYLQENITGTVYISFVIDTTGKIADIKVERGVAGFTEFENAAVQSISKMPKWIPGSQNGLKVPVKLTMPVRFDVKKDF